MYFQRISKGAALIRGEIWVNCKLVNMVNCKLVNLLKLCFHTDLDFDHLDFEFNLIRRDLVLNTFKNKFRYLNPFIITSRYKFLYSWKEFIVWITWV